MPNLRFFLASAANIGAISPLVTITLHYLAGFGDKGLLQMFENIRRIDGNGSDRICINERRKYFEA